MIHIIVWLCATICSAILYRMGGAEGYNTKFRDFGVPFVGIALLAYLNPLHADFKTWIAYFLTFGLYFGSMTTYWKKKGTGPYWT